MTCVFIYIEKKLSYKFEKYFKNETKKLTSTKEQQQLQQPLTVLQLFPLQLFPLSLNIVYIYIYIELRVFLNALFPFIFFVCFVWWFPWGVTWSLQGAGGGELISSQVALCIYYTAQYNTRGSLRVRFLDRSATQKVCYTYLKSIESRKSFSIK